MTRDELKRYAGTHGYRTRNLNDGRPVPPAWQRRGDAVAGYQGAADREDAICTRWGYVCPESGGRVGWFIQRETPKKLTLALRRIRAAGGTVVQEGDIEAAGLAPDEAIDDLLKAMRVWQRQRPAPLMPVGAKDQRNGPGW